MNPLHVATVSSEMVPLAKSGGLGDVCGSLPIALDEIGCRSSCFLPAYRSVFESGLDIKPTNDTFTIQMEKRHVACRLLKTRLPDSEVDVHLIDQPQYFDRDGFYFDHSGEYRDNCERFSFFCRAVVTAIDKLKLDVDIVHCHDWQTGLVPAYMKTKFGGYAWMERARSIMTIHNLAYQGRFWHFDMPLTGLDWKYFNMNQMEFYGDISFLKTGIMFSDRLTTVSPTYAREITTPAHGCGLDDILKKRGQDLVGIVNGVDYSQWNPSIGRHLPRAYGPDDWQTGKAHCKRELQVELGLPEAPHIPLVGIVSRLADQKGWDLIIPLLLHWANVRDVQWVILGTGDPKYEQQLREIAHRYPRRLAVRLEFSERLAHRIEAASDMFLMPSRYEPCGLNQLYSLKYGAVPVVNSTGGLVDTVTDTNEETLANRTATGFRFAGYALTELEKTLERAMDFYLHHQPIWTQIVHTGMLMDWSWKKSAERYKAVYEETVNSR